MRDGRCGPRERLSDKVPRRKRLACLGDDAVLDSPGWGPGGGFPGRAGWEGCPDVGGRGAGGDSQNNSQALGILGLERDEPPLLEDPAAAAAAAAVAVAVDDTRCFCLGSLRHRRDLLVSGTGALKNRPRGRGEACRRSTRYGRRAICSRRRGRGRVRRRRGSDNGFRDVVLFRGRRERSLRCARGLGVDFDGRGSWKGRRARGY